MNLLLLLPKITTPVSLYQADKVQRESATDPYKATKPVFSQFKTPNTQFKIAHQTQTSTFGSPDRNNGQKPLVTHTTQRTFQGHDTNQEPS